MLNPSSNGILEVYRAGGGLNANIEGDGCG
jgi:hypothetical protein